MPRRPEVLSLVERGWRGTRECSLKLSSRGIAVTHVIKGWAPKEVQAMVTPVPLVRMVWVRRWWFRLPAWGLLIGRTLAGGLRWVIVDHERTVREVSWWCRLAGIRVVMMREHDDDYHLWLDGRSVIEESELWGGAACVSR